MLERKFVREYADRLREQFAARRKEADLDGFLRLDAERRRLLQEADTLKARRNLAGAEIPRLRQAGQDASALLAEMKAVADQIKALDAQLAELEGRTDELLLTFPNVFHESVPIGAGDQDNVEIRRWGEPRAFEFPPRPHWEIGELTGTLDFERGVRMAQSRFALELGAAARLSRALANFMLDLHTREHGYTEAGVPLLVNREAMTGTGQIPNLEGEMFRCRDDELWLIPTAEVSLTNVHRTETFAEVDLPRALVAHTPCFRREAGSYGRDVRGLIRLHQFYKVELVRLVAPDRSYEELEILTGHAETVLQRLGLPYRVVSLCSADLSFAAAKCHDLEVWLPSQQTFREISSCSNFESFQARRCQIRFKPRAGGKSELVHTLNGSGLAIGRTLVAIYENYQRADGSVEIPAALRPYMGGAEEIPAG